MVASDFKIKVLPVSKKLFRSALLILRNEEEARDVVQDVFLKLWQKRGELELVDNVEAFAMRMTRNRCIDVMRANRYVSIDREAGRMLKEEPDDITPDMEVSETAGRIKKLIEELPETQRQVMQLRDIEQLEYEEIAGITGLQVNAIRVNLSRARKRVRDEFLKMNSDGNGRSKTNFVSLF